VCNVRVWKACFTLFSHAVLWCDASYLGVRVRVRVRARVRGRVRIDAELVYLLQSVPRGAKSVGIQRAHHPAGMCASRSVWTFNVRPSQPGCVHPGSRQPLLALPGRAPQPTAARTCPTPATQQRTNIIHRKVASQEREARWGFEMLPNRTRVLLLLQWAAAATDARSANVAASSAARYTPAHARQL
jgi:hypothetical protein